MGEEPERGTLPGGRETHVKHTPTGGEGVRSVLERERELLREKARLLAEGKYREPRTAWIGMRVPPTVKSLYDRAPEYIKLAARRAFEAVILSWYISGGSVTQPPQAPVGQPFIFNININNVESKAEVNLDMSKLVEIIEHLYELRRPLPPLQKKLVEQLHNLVSEWLTGN